MTESSSADQIFLEKLTGIILANLGNEHFGANELAREYGSTRTRLNRRLLKLTQKTVRQFINEVRLRKALDILRSEDVTVAEVAYRTGFGSPTYFNTSFHDFFGISPGKVKKGEKELFHNGNIPPPDTSGSKQMKPARRTVILSLAGIVFLAALVLQFIYPGHIISFKRYTLVSLKSQGGRLSVAVMPFQNLTYDTIWNVWQNGIQDILITYLSNFPRDLEVRQTGSIYNLVRNKGLPAYASITASAAGNISRKLDADVFIYGNVRQAETLLRLNAKLINSRTEEILKSFESDWTSGEGNIIHVIDSLKRMVTNYIIISNLKKEVYPDFQEIESSSPEAYRYFIHGQNAYFDNDFSSAINWFSQSLAADSTFVYAVLYTALSYANKYLYQEARKWCLKAYGIRDRMPIYQRTYTDFVYSRLFGTPHESIKYLKQLLEIDDQIPGMWFKLSERYGELEQYDKAITAAERSFELYKQMRLKPDTPSEYIMLGTYYHETGEFRKEKRLYRKAEKDFPENGSLLKRQAVLALAERDTVKVNYYLGKYISLSKELSQSEAELAWNIAIIYWLAGFLDEAEMYSRKALSLDPDNADILSNVAWFLVDADRNIDDGMKYIAKADSIHPDPVIYLDCKGWGLFKQGHYEDALELLEKCYEGCI